MQPDTPIADDRTHTASRVIAAAPQALYGACMDAQALMQWLPPEGATGTADTFEPWPGGRFRMVLAFAQGEGKSGGNTDVVEGRYIQLVPGERIVQAISFQSEDPAFAGVMTMTWLFEAQPGGTRVTVVAQDVPRGIARADHEQAIASTLGNLARYAGRALHP
jgi:uncharacterized protein YndB with AHSA1/START domain